MITPHIRWMIRRDMPEVLSIEKGSFEFSWDEDDFIRFLRQRCCIGMVAEHGEQVVGFMVYELHRKRFHLLRFAVHPDVRRQGVGAAMVAKLRSKQSRPTIRFEVRETNVPAQLFLQTFGFRAVAVLRGFYDDTDEDAYVMEYSKAQIGHLV